MPSTIFTRREFLKGCCSAAAIAASGPRLLFAAAPNAHDTVISLFLRGGIDGLNLVVPTDGADRIHYEQARPSLTIPVSGAYGALPLTLANGQSTHFGLHPAAAGLHEIWTGGKLAIVHACGLATVESRSHFDAQAYVDLGTPGSKGTTSGWLTRAWLTAPEHGGAAAMPALSTTPVMSTSFLASTEALNLQNPDDFALNAGPWQWQRARDGSPPGFRGINEMLVDLWQGAGTLEAAGRRTDGSLKLIGQQDFGAPPDGWPATEFARELWTIAQSIRLGLGLRYATIDLGGWDTHDGQGTVGEGYHYYQQKVAELSTGLHAFFQTLTADGYMSRVTVVVQSEFGRRVRQNANRGTDHGYGNPLLVLGGPVNGRRLYGTWPGLDPEILSPHFGDLPVTTDHRRVLSEILVRRMGNYSLGTVFPDYTGYYPMGVVQPRS